MTAESYDIVIIGTGAGTLVHRLACIGKKICQSFTGWWLQSEDLPAPENRLRLMGDRICLEYKQNNTTSP